MNEIPSRAIEQANQEVQQEDCHSQHVSFHVNKFRVYLILYTRLLKKLNLFEILLYGAFIT